MSKKQKIYIAGPLFSNAEREFNLRIRSICLNCGYSVFLPLIDAPVLNESNAEEVFSAELRALENADIIVANLDGIDVDSGTAWEIGYAVARGKTIIGVRTDWRVFSKNESVNLMIEQSVFIVHSLANLEKALKASV